MAERSQRETSGSPQRGRLAWAGPQELERWTTATAAIQEAPTTRVQEAVQDLGATRLQPVQEPKTAGETAWAGQARTPPQERRGPSPCRREREPPTTSWPVDERGDEKCFERSFERSFEKSFAPAQPQLEMETLKTIHNEVTHACQAVRLERQARTRDMQEVDRKLEALKETVWTGLEDAQEQLISKMAGDVEVAVLGAELRLAKQVEEVSRVRDQGGQASEKLRDELMQELQALRAELQSQDAQHKREREALRTTVGVELAAARSGADVETLAAMKRAEEALAQERSMRQEVHLEVAALQEKGKEVARQLSGLEKLCREARSGDLAEGLELEREERLAGLERLRAELARSVAATCKGVKSDLVKDIQTVVLRALPQELDDLRAAVHKDIRADVRAEVQEAVQGAGSQLRKSLLSELSQELEQLREKAEAALASKAGSAVAGLRELVDEERRTREHAVQAVEARVAAAATAKDAEQVQQQLEAVKTTLAANLREAVQEAAMTHEAALQQCVEAVEGTTAQCKQLAWELGEEREARGQAMATFHAELAEELKGSQPHSARLEPLVRRVAVAVLAEQDEARSGELGALYEELRQEVLRGVESCEGQCREHVRNVRQLAYDIEAEKENRGMEIAGLRSEFASVLLMKSGEPRRDHEWADCSRQLQDIRHEVLSLQTISKSQDEQVIFMRETLLPDLQASVRGTEIRQNAQTQHCQELASEVRGEKEARNALVGQVRAEAEAKHRELAGLAEFSAESSAKSLQEVEELRGALEQLRKAAVVVGAQERVAPARAGATPEELSHRLKAEAEARGQGLAELRAELLGLLSSRLQELQGDLEARQQLALKDELAGLAENLAEFSAESSATSSQEVAVLRESLELLREEQAQEASRLRGALDELRKAAPAQDHRAQERVAPSRAGATAEELSHKLRAEAEARNQGLAELRAELRGELTSRLQELQSKLEARQQLALKGRGADADDAARVGLAQLRAELAEVELRLQGRVQGLSEEVLQRAPRGGDAGSQDELGTSMVRFEIAELRAAVDAVAGERAQEGFPRQAVDVEERLRVCLQDESKRLEDRIDKRLANLTINLNKDLGKTEMQIERQLEELRGSLAQASPSSAVAATEELRVMAGSVEKKVDESLREVREEVSSSLRECMEMVFEEIGAVRTLVGQPLSVRGSSLAASQANHVSPKASTPTPSVPPLDLNSIGKVRER